MNWLLLSKKHIRLEKRILAAIHRANRYGRVAIFFALFLAVITSSRSRVGFCAEIGMASWYSAECCKYNPTKGCPTASGKSLYELERTKQDFAAAWNYPMGTRLKVANLGNGKSVTVTVLDRGPAKRLHRAIDLSKGAFRKISPLKHGLIRVKVEKILPSNVGKTLKKTKGKA